MRSYQKTIANSILQLVPLNGDVAIGVNLPTGIGRGVIIDHMILDLQTRTNREVVYVSASRLICEQQRRISGKYNCDSIVEAIKQNYGIIVLDNSTVIRSRFYDQLSADMIINVSADYDDVVTVSVQHKLPIG